MLRVSGDLDTHIKFYHEVRHVTHLHTLHACLHVYLLDLFLSHVSCMLCTGLHATMYYRSHPHLHTNTSTLSVVRMARMHTAPHTCLHTPLPCGLTH